VARPSTHNAVIRNGMVALHGLALRI
jgi:hypothetical protein